MLGVGIGAVEAIGLSLRADARELGDGERTTYRTRDDDPDPAALDQIRGEIVDLCAQYPVPAAALSGTI